MIPGGGDGAARGNDPTVALVRLELLYPWPESAIAELKKRYTAAEWVFCQEEPANMGAWFYVRDRWPFANVVSRPPAASPAPGSLQRHKHEQAELVRRALGAEKKALPSS